MHNFDKSELSQHDVADTELPFPVAKLNTCPLVLGIIRRVVW